MNGGECVTKVIKQSVIPRVAFKDLYNLGRCAVHNGCFYNKVCYSILIQKQNVISTVLFIEQPLYDLRNLGRNVNYDIRRFLFFTMDHNGNKSVLFFAPSIVYKHINMAVLPIY